MASRLTASDVLDLLEDDDFGWFSGEDSDFEGEGVTSYLPEAGEHFSDGGEGPQLNEEDVEESDEEGMEEEDHNDTPDSPGASSAHDSG